ncbi:hypothetical protein ACE10Z_23635 [Bradyrhizobium sp. Pha-3]|uniref:hypothetical protein n=1 Tax=Bradyrhizobium sp. Pha-3 TaxID=208375 RepID=UPI0035D45BBD
MTTEADLAAALAKFDDAIARDDEKAGREALVALATITIGGVLRIAAALEHIGRNIIPEKT